jgi:hypothetical protein
MKSKAVHFVLPFTIFFFVLTNVHAQFHNEDAALGTNMFTIEDYSPSWIFVDAFKASRDWLPQRDGVWDTGETLNLDNNGWVQSLQNGQWAGSLLFRGIEGRYPAGDYLMLYDGVGEFEINFDAQVISESPGRKVLRVTPSTDGILIRILNTGPLNYIKNIRVIMPGYWDTYETEIFHPLFIQSLNPFNVIRFMDWQKTNFSANQHWSDRTTSSHNTQARPQGASVEHMIDLCNRVKADPWFCIPHQATDDYITQFATLVKNNLDPQLRVYIEHSNEIWNSGFSQGLYVQNNGLSLWPELNTSTGKFEARMRMHSKRSVEIFDIWESVFGGTNQLVRVIASQHANNWTATKALEWNDAYLKTDALATAPYFGNELGDPGKGLNTPSRSVDWILDYCEADIEIERERTQTNKAVANGFGVDLIAYEGGQHMAALHSWVGNATLNAKFFAANRHPRMQEIYKTYIEGWKADGGGVFTAFTLQGKYNNFGSWGLLEWSDQSYLTAPKYLGLVEGGYGDLEILAIPALTKKGLALLTGVFGVTGVILFSRMG